jgi:DNA-directed RNA polymerase subunit E'/Rpb7
VGANYHNFEKQLSNIRREVVFITNAVTYRTSFFLAIPKIDLLGDGYTYYDIVYEQALFFPLIEMMCGLVFKIDEFFLLTKEPFEDYDDYL